MYKSAEQYLNPKSDGKMTYREFIRENYEPFKEVVILREDEEPPKDSYVPHIHWETKEYSNISDPKVWGPPFWFSLHSSAANYPIEASNLVRERMKGRLLAIPYEIPCSACRPHASAYIEANKSRMDDICSGRDKLFNFYVDFHNKVNQRYGKPIFTYEDAKRMWMRGMKVSVLKME